MLTIHLQGGLGNQLFQVAAAETIARQTNRRLVLPPCRPTHHSSQDYFTTILSDFAHLRGDLGGCTVVREPSFTYREWTLPDGPVSLDGYFQNSRYVSETFRDRLVCPDGIPESPGAFLHLRGGDYVNHPFHDVKLDAYYQNAIKEFPPDTHFFVFTNDLAYAKTSRVLQTVSHTIVEEPDEVRALWRMSRCRAGGLCANSTFSWWGAYLNPQRTLVLPPRWFNDSSIVTEGYFFPGSIKGSESADSVSLRASCP
jgi:hypothetical protein